jgi:hypothetical protein
MRGAAVAMAVVLSLIVLWWTFGYVWRRTRGRRR